MSSVDYNNVIFVRVVAIYSYIARFEGEGY